MIMPFSINNISDDSKKIELVYRNLNKFQIEKERNDITNQDILKFLDGIDPSDITINHFDNDLCLIVEGSGDVTIGGCFYNWLENEFSLDMIEFADGTQWDRARIQDWLDRTGNGDDELTETDVVDLLKRLACDNRYYVGAADETHEGEFWRDAA
jgi:hypothetical protein